MGPHFVLLRIVSFVAFISCVATSFVGYVSVSQFLELCSDY